MGKTTNEAKKAAKSVETIDREATRDAAKYRDAPAVKAVGFLAEIADQPQLIATSVGTLVVGVIVRRPDLIRGGARMLLAHLVATAAKSVIKHSIDRTRPEQALNKGGYRFEKGDSKDHEQSSFPSGHTAGAVAVARAASRDIPGVGGPAALATTAIAAAQPATGSHYFSDLVAGAAVGWIAEAVVTTVFDRVFPTAEDAVVEQRPTDQPR